MIHHRQCLPLGFEAGDDLLGVHAQLDHLECDTTPHGLRLLRDIHHAAPALADTLQDFVASDFLADDFLGSIAEIELHPLAHAECAAEGGWTRPEIDSGSEFEIRGGRHPTVEAALAGKGAFIANDCVLADDRIWLVTGPNMAGKSTFLRQNALIVILAQIGSFVPARSARIGTVDRLFSRVGAADDLARGRSTFMVEMVESAAILNQAGPKSFVILDEIGRGTSTYDGLSIAWAALEHLHEVNRCRALFATHYHHLNELEKQLVGVKNFRVICGYSIFEELHCGQRISAAEMSGSVDSHSIIRLCAFSKSLSSTMTLAFACGLDMKPNCCMGASL